MKLVVHFYATATRVLFTVKDDQMILLHGFIKKTQRTPAADIHLAQSRRDF